jgi:hypothetical protein
MLGAALLVSMITLGLGCRDQPSARRVVSRAFDTHDAKMPNALSTHSQPRLALAGQTRPLIAPLPTSQPTIHVHASLNLDLPENAFLHFGFGLRPSTGLTGSVAFAVSIGTGERSSTIFERELPLDGRDAVLWVDLNVSGHQFKLLLNKPNRIGTIIITETCPAPEVGEGSRLQPRNRLFLRSS